MKVRIFAVLLIGAVISVSSMAYAGDAQTRQFGDGIKLGGIMKTLTIKPLAMEDPDNPFVTIYFTHVKGGRLATVDPSNSSVAARLTGPIPMKDGKQVIDQRATLELFKTKKSWMSKALRIARFYDPKKNTLIYITYSKKLIDGSAKHSLSVVHLGEVQIKK
jgi:CreA protein